jgi:uncharacterized protein YktA (UPF0223 family)
VGSTDLGSESETCVGSCVHLVGVSISFEKNFYRLPFTPPSSGSPYRSFKGQTAEEFIEEIEKKVDTMIGESTMNEYKAYKNLVKHKKRINHVFSEVCGENSFRSRRPGIDKKAPAVAVASCSAAPPKAPRRKSSKNRNNSTNETSSSAVRPEKTKSLESSKRKHKTSKLFQTSKFRQL